MLCSSLDRPARPSNPPGTYFRMLLVGYFEGIESQLGVARLHEFPNVAAHESTPGHSTLTHNLGRILRKLLGIGQPRILQGGCAPASPLDFLFASLTIMLQTIFALRPVRR